LMEAYQAVYAPQVNEDYLWESYLTEEFISEAYQTVADYLVYNGFVPGYNTAEVYMSEMAVEDIDSILFETGVLDEQYLIEAGFFQGIGAGADRFVSGAQRRVQGAVNTVVGGTQRAVNAGQRAVRGAGQAVVGGTQRAVNAVRGAVTPVAQAVQGTAQRAVNAGQSALGGAARAVQGAGQAVVGGTQRAVNAAGSAVNSATRRIGQEVEISRKVGAGEPLKPTAAKPAAPAPAAKPQFGTTTPRNSSVTSTGVSGLSAANRAAYSAGGGNAAAQRGMGQTTAQVIAQGKNNLGRMDQGRTAPASARPTSGPSAVNPKSGVAGFPAARPAAAPAARPAAPAATTGNPPLKPPALPPVTGKPSLRSGLQSLKDMGTASRQRQGLTQSFDPFDVVFGHLIDEGYADTEEAALQIMANMSEEWKNSIIG